MQKLIIAAVATVLLLAGCAPSTSAPIENVEPTSLGDDVDITEINDSGINDLLAAGSTFDEFAPVLEGSTISFFTSGSSSCKNEPIGARVSEQYTMVLFRIYPSNTACTEDFGIYGWEIEFNETAPFVGTEFVRCEIDTCYPDNGEEFAW